MNEKRKTPPRRTSTEFLEDQISQAQRRGDFDDLPGKGQPLPNLSNDPLWWVKDKLRREGASVLPPGLQLKRDKEIALDEIAKMSNEILVRKRLLALNEHIRRTNASILAGPPSNLAPLDVEAQIELWRSSRAAADDSPSG